MWDLLESFDWVYLKRVCVKLAKKKSIVFGFLLALVVFVLSISASASAVQSYSIPNWVKGIAGWWSDGKVSDDKFASAIQSLINQNIIKIPPNSSLNSTQSLQISIWVKNTAGWWANDQISDDEFIKAIQWMINESMIKIPQSNLSQTLANPAPQTAPQSPVSSEAASAGYTNLTKGVVNGAQLTQRTVNGVEYYFFPPGSGWFVDVIGNTDPLCKSGSSHTVKGVAGYAEYSSISNMESGNYVGSQPAGDNYKILVLVVGRGNAIVFYCVTEANIHFHE